MLTQFNKFNKREWLAQVLDRVFFFDLMASLRNDSKRLIILAYHRIYDPSNSDEQIFDEGPLSATVDDFEKQVRWLKKYFHICTFNDVINQKLEHNSVIISFDDGYKDNYNYAFPILKKYKVPATFFIATGYLEAGKLFWWDEVAFLLKKQPKPFSCQILDDYCCNLMNDSDMIWEVICILKWLISLPNVSREKAMIEIRELFGGAEFYPDLSRKMIMNWDDVREMSKSGMEFGNHTVNHKILSKIDDVALEYEIIEASKELESKIGIKPCCFSYPVGTTEDFDDRVGQLLAKAEIPFASTYMSGENYIANLNSFQLRRNRVEMYNSLAMVKLKLIFPCLFDQ